MARKIKLDKLSAGLKDNMWDPVKIQKKGYTPRHTKLKNRQGQEVYDRMRAETLADYHGHEHWAEDREDRPEDQYILLAKRSTQAKLTCKN